MASPHTFTEQPPLNAPITVPVQAPPTTQVQPDRPVQPSKVETTPEPLKIEPGTTASEILKRSTVKTDVTPQRETNYREDLEKITDPAQKAILEKALKDYEAGYTKKFQDLSQERKKLDEMSRWTPTRLAEELRKPEFISAMQTLQQQSAPQDWAGTGEEWSALSDSDKRQIQQMRQEQQSLQSQLMSLRMKEEDVEIKKLYPDYDPQIVDEAVEGLRSGKINANRADIWKVVNHDNNVEKGYKLGLEDGYKKALEKMNGSSITSGNLSVTGADDVPEDIRSKGFASIAGWRLSRLRNGAKK